jgi:hypothetical protein
MRHEIVDDPSATLDRVVESLRSNRSQPKLPVWAARMGYLGGLTATAVAGALLWVNRRHPGLVSPA